MTFPLWYLFRSPNVHPFGLLRLPSRGCSQQPTRHTNSHKESHLVSVPMSSKFFLFCLPQLSQAACQSSICTLFLLFSHLLPQACLPAEPLHPSVDGDRTLVRGCVGQLLNVLVTTRFFPLGWVVEWVRDCLKISYVLGWVSGVFVVADHIGSLGLPNLQGVRNVVCCFFSLLGGALSFPDWGWWVRLESHWTFQSLRKLGLLGCFRFCPSVRGLV